MRTSLNILVNAALLAGVLGAAETSNPLSSGQKAIYEIVSGSLVKGAEKMPEENYTFKPTPEVRSFGELVAHAADAQYLFCSAASSSKSPVPKVEGAKTSKADLVEALKQAVAYCEKVYSGMTDSEGAQMTKFFGRDSAKLTILAFNTAHSDEHYGNMVTYLRLKNIVPPTSERRN